MSKKDNDITMKDASKGEDGKKDDKKEEQKKPEEVKEEPKLSPRDQTLKDFRDTLKSLDEGVQKHDRRLILRAVRTINPLRKRLNADILTSIAKQFAPELISLINVADGKQMKDVTPAKESKAASGAPNAAPEKPVVYASSPPQPEPVAPHLVLPETKIFIQIVVVHHMLDVGCNDESVGAFQSLLKLLHSHNRRTLDILSARVYFLWSLVYERTNSLQTIRDDLLAAHRTASLQHNEPGTAALINNLLRNYLHYNLFEQAGKFLAKAPFPANRPNNESARYSYYQGRIEAMQLRYSDAYGSLSQAIRKAPVKSALGFRQKAHKLIVIVQLLMGDIPERSIFNHADLKKSLRPYFKLTQAVRVGDVAAFREVQSKFKDVFSRDGSYSLIVRLYQNVIKTGLRKINLSYSRISFKDIIQKLNMQGMERKMEDAEKDMEYIVAKAIHDGVIDAVIDHKGKFIYSKENVDIYSTNEPQQAFHKRIKFCTDVHNEAVKALAFPPNAVKPKVEYESFQDDDEEVEADSKGDKSMDDDH